MPNKYMKELLCDWRGAGRMFNGKDAYKNDKREETRNFYLSRRDNIMLHPITRKKIEKII